MISLVRAGVALAALTISMSAIAQTLPPTQGAAPRAPRKNYFNSNQARADVSTRVAKMFAALDLNRDGFITRDEITASQAKFDDQMTKGAPRRAARLFDRLDTDRDGRITQAEIEARRTSRSPLAAASTPRRPSKSSVIRLADTNGDGTVTRAEYDAAVASGKLKPHHPRMRGSMLARLFDKAGVNRDGRLTLQQAQQAALERFDSADTNRDGVLTPDERRQAARAERVRRRPG